MASERKRQTRTRQAAGELSREQPSHPKGQNKKSNNISLAEETKNFAKGNSNHKGFHNRQDHARENKTNQTNVSVAATQDYEPVSYMESKPKDEVGDLYLKRPIEDRIPLTKMEIISNWNTFDGAILDEELLIQGDDYLLGEDFSYVLKINELDGAHGYLHLKGEAAWGDISALEKSLGDLRVSDLAEAFATIPFQQQVRIPEDMLPSISIVRYSKIAGEKKECYSPNSGTTTASVDEVNQKMLQTLSFQGDELSATIEDESDSIQARLTGRSAPTKSGQVSRSIEKTGEIVAVNQFNLNLAEAKVTASAPTSRSEERTTQKEELLEEFVVDRLIADSKKNSTLKNTSISVPVLDDGKSAIVEPKKVSEADELEDWLDSILCV